MLIKRLNIASEEQKDCPFYIKYNTLLQIKTAAEGIGRIQRNKLCLNRTVSFAQRLRMIKYELIRTMC